MSISKVVAVVAFLCTSTLAEAGNTAISQHNQLNIYGSVQVGGSTSISVAQKGFGNVAGVIQVSPKPVATIRQTGTYNGAGVGQVSSQIFSYGMP